MRELTFFSAHCTRKFLPFNEIPSVPIVSIAFEASSLSANETYPTPFDTFASSTTNADLTGARSEKRVCKSVDVAA